MIRYTTDIAPNVTFSVSQFVFPAGEVGVDINFTEDGHAEYKVKKIMIEARLQNSVDVMALIMTVDALRRAYHGLQWIGLALPYVPYARQDRVCNQGESLSIAAFASIINSLGLNVVEIADPHSSVTPALISNCIVTNQWDIFHDIYPSWREVHIVAPDAGATKKCEDFAKRVGAAGVITCSKTRELSTGKITGLTCDADVTGLNLLVLDDICDGGRTFIEVAYLFGNTAASMDLAVTHGIFSKGVECVLSVFRHVYTTNSYHDDLNELQWDGLTVIDIFK